MPKLEPMQQPAGRTGGRREGAAAVLAAGLALFVIGYTGLFFARLIKAAGIRAN